MKKDEIKIGQVYTAKVTDKVVPVRIDAVNPHGGWDATNLVTNKKVGIKSAQRLRSRAPAPGTGSSSGAAKAADAIKKGNLADGIKVPRKPVKKKLTKKEQETLRARHKADQENARLRDERKASADGMTASERAMAASKEPKAKDTATSRKKREGMSCLDAAAKVLAEAGEPMTTKAMVEAMVAKGYWTTAAPTPWATLYSALLREMQKKGDDARFVKAGRGMFGLSSAAPAPGPGRKEA